MNRFLDQCKIRVRALPWPRIGAIYLPRALVALLVIFAAVQLAKITWMLIGEDTSHRSFVAAGKARASSSGNDFVTLSDLRVFGEVKGAVVSRPIRNPSSYKPLNLWLSGIIHAENETEVRMALLAPPNAVPLVYGLGDAIQPGVFVDDIAEDYVVILNHGMTQKLELPKYNPIAVNITRAATADASVKVVTRSTKRKLERYRKQIEGNPLAVAGVIQGRPVVRQGKVVGLLLTQGLDATLMEELALRPNDVLMNVNGIPVGDTSRVSELLELMKRERRFDLLLEREGAQQQLTIYLDG